jgi:hypothetical protein
VALVVLEANVFASLYEAPTVWALTCSLNNENVKVAVATPPEPTAADSVWPPSVKVTCPVVTPTPPEVTWAVTFSTCVKSE